MRFAINYLVETYTNPYLLQRALANVDLPDPGGPIIMILADLVGA